MKRVLSILLLFVIAAQPYRVAVADNQFDLSTKSLEDDGDKISEAQERCRNISSLIIKKSFKLDCFTNYNHYGPTTKAARTSTSIKIANYNLLHPGTSKTLFKDYGIMAKIMNRYDIVAGLELLATVGRDEQNNKAVLAFIESAPEMLEKLSAEKSITAAPVKLSELSSKIDLITKDLKKSYDLYRAPGYLKVLQELKKLDPSWSLILSPRGDSAQIGSVEELTGFFYRANIATPAINPHCKEMMDDGAGTPVACFITLEQSFMGKDVVQHFARRPFMASFKIGAQQITLVTSHVVFTYSGDEEAEKDLMMKTFGVESYKDLGAGINAGNFARYAEVKNTLEFMDLYRKKYKDKKIMFLADMNLVSKNVFWPEVLKAFPGGELLIKEATTLSPTRITSGGVATNGVANDYDHFILEKSQFSTCSSGEVFNYYKEGIYSEIESRYIIRQEIVGFNKNLKLDENIDNLLGIGLRNDKTDLLDDGDILPDDPVIVKLDYPLTPAGQSKMDKFVGNFGKYLKSLQTVRRNEVVQDDFQLEERLEGLKRRVFLRQLTNPFYYRFMQEVLSDHFPISITCKF